jgi:hypothetical protein
VAAHQPPPSVHDGTGLDELWTRVGGRAGLWGVNIDEGTIDDDRKQLDELKADQPGE